LEESYEDIKSMSCWEWFVEQMSLQKNLIDFDWEAYSLDVSSRPQQTFSPIPPFSLPCGP